MADHDTPVLHHGDRTRSLRVRWVLEELGVPHRVAPVLFPPRVRQPQYLQENPVGSLPLFVDGEVRLTESMAICQYLVAKHAPTKLAVAPDEPGFPAYLQFSWLGEAGLMPPVGALVGQIILTSEAQRSAKAIEEAHALLARRLQPVTAVLARSDHLAADRFTLADVSVGYAIGLAIQLGASDVVGPDAVRYHARLTERPAYRSASVPVNA